MKMPFASISFTLNLRQKRVLRTVFRLLKCEFEVGICFCFCDTRIGRQSGRHLPMAHRNSEGWINSCTTAYFIPKFTQYVKITQFVYFIVGEFSPLPPPPPDLGDEAYVTPSSKPNIPGWVPENYEEKGRV